MVDVVPVTILAIGASTLLWPETWAEIERRRKAMWTTAEPDDVELSDSYDALLRIGGVCAVLFGLYFSIRSW